jgi:hypothetical protein
MPPQRGGAEGFVGGGCANAISLIILTISIGVEIMDIPSPHGMVIQLIIGDNLYL